MKIQTIKAFKKNLALQKPYTIARETITDVENVFLQIKLENGICGIGAANPAPEVVGETPDQTFENLQSSFVESLIGQDIRQSMGMIARSREHFSDLPGTQACIDIALHDAFGQFLGIPVVDLYGQRHQKMLTSVTIGIRDLHDTIAEARDYFAQGFKVLKVKTGLDAATDAERVIRLREEFGKDFILRVDANTGYNLDQLRLFLKQTADANLELIEQPLLPSIDVELFQLSAEERSKLAADESLKNAASALRLSQQGLYGIFNIKLMKCGGISGAMEIATIAKPAGIDLFWGCNDESIVSITAALHAAFACPHTKYLDLDGSFDLAGDLVKGGFRVREGWMSLTGEAGLGLKFAD